MPCARASLVYLPENGCIWLQAKRLIREFYFFCHSFSVVKVLFELLLHCQIFDLSQLYEYGVFS